MEQCCRDNEDLKAAGLNQGHTNIEAERCVSVYLPETLRRCRLRLIKLGARLSCQTECRLYSNFRLTYIDFPCCTHRKQWGPTPRDAVLRALGFRSTPPKRPGELDAYPLSRENRSHFVASCLGTRFLMVTNGGELHSTVANGTPSAVENVVIFTGPGVVLITK